MSAERARVGADGRALGRHGWRSVGRRGETAMRRRGEAAGGSAA